MNRRMNISVYKGSRLIAIVVAVFVANPLAYSPVVFAAPGQSLLEQAKGLAGRIFRRSGSETKYGAKKAAAALGREEAVTSGEKASDEIAKMSDGLFSDVSVAIKNGEMSHAYVGHELELENILTNLVSRNYEGLFLSGAQGSGRNHMIFALQEEISSGKYPQLANTRIVRVNTEHIDFKQSTRVFEIANNLKNKVSEVEGQPLRYILYFDDMAAFVPGPANSGKSALDLAEYAGIFRQIFGRDIKFIGRAQPGMVGEIEKMAPRVREVWKKIDLLELNSQESFSALRHFADKMEVETNFQISDEIVKQADVWGRQYFPERSAPGSGVFLLEEAISRKMIALRKGYAEISQELRKERALLVEEFEELKGLSGSYARKRSAAIPQLIKEVDERIVSLEKETLLLSKRAQLLHKSDELKKRVAQIEEKAAKGIVSTEEKSAVEQARNGVSSIEAQVVEIERSVDVSSVTRSDLALSINRNKPNYSFTEILVQKQVYAEDEIVKQIGERLLGQGQLLTLLRRIYRAKDSVWRGSKRPDAPEFVFLLLGPPGTGKTEFNILLAKYLKNDSLIKLNMGEYSSATSVSRLTGADPNYAGYDQGSFLVNSLRANPKSVVLLDEFGREHFSVHEPLLNFLENGTMTSGNGLTASAHEAIVGASSNLLMDEISAGEITAETAEEAIKTILKTGFRSLADHNVMTKLDGALVDRINAIVVLNPLDAETKAKILLKKVKDLQDEMIKRRLGLEIDDSTASYLITKLPDGQLSARGVDGVFQKNLITHIDDIIQSGGYFSETGERVALTIRKGQTLKVEYDPERGLVFSVH